jgi:uroporphyrinogen-III synthase
VNDLTPVLAGTRILITAQRRADELAGALERRGATVTVASALGVESQVDEEGLLRRTRELLASPVDAVVLTTGIGFRGWLDTAGTAGLGEELLAALAMTRLIARGPKARGALQAAGLRADWVAESETSAEILEFLLAEGVGGDRIAIQHHGAGDPAFEDRLTGAGAEVLPLQVYRWGPPPDPQAVVEATLALAAGDYDAVLFTSAPAAQAMLAALAEQGVTEIVRDRAVDGKLLVAAVGPVTAEPLATAGLMPVHPDRSRMGALVRLVILSLGERVDGVATPEGVLRIRASAATLDHEPLSLSPTGLALLRRLAREPGRVVSRQHLLHALPGESADPHAVEVAVARLRDSLGPRQLVRTVVKRGYVLQTR